MKNWQKRKNEEFFEMIIGITKNNLLKNYK